MSVSLFLTRLLSRVSREKSFEHAYVREYAVEVLRSASDDELLLFLLQLVQALRYEPASSLAHAEAVTIEPSTPTVATVVTTSAASTTKTTDSIDVAVEQTANGIKSMAIQSNTDAGSSDKSNGPPPGSGSLSNLSPLGKFLIDRACKSPVVANYLYWYLKVETALEEEENLAGGVFNSTWDTFVVQLSQSKETQMLFKRLLALDEYISQIAETHREARTRGKRREAKEQMLVKLLEDKNLRDLPSGLDWVPMPLDPAIKLTGLVPTGVKMFASAVYPVVIEFRELVEASAVPPPPPVASTTSNSGPDANTPATSPVPPVVVKPRSHKIMFKSGDDLRQDQLIMQMISLMDSLLKRVNLDLKLLTYGILAVGPSDGIMEFVQNSMPISAILKNFGSITEYLRSHNPDKNGPYGISAVYVCCCFVCLFGSVFC